MTKRKILYIILSIIVVVIIIRSRSLIADIISPFAISMIIAYLFNPLIIMFQNKGIKRTYSVILLFFILFFFILIFCIVFMPRIIKEIYVLVENIPTYSMQISKTLIDLEIKLLNSNMPNSIKQIIYNNITIAENIIVSFLQKSIDMIINAISNSLEIALIPVITFYLLTDSKYFIDQAKLLIPKNRREKILKLLKDIDSVVGKFIRGQIIVCIFIALFTSITLILLNVKYAVVLGIFAGLTNVIPYFGPIIAAIPIILFAFIDSINKAIYVTIAFIVIQQLEGDIITPKIIGESVGIHPVYVILSIVIGAKTLGIIGMLLALPVVASFKLIIRYFIRGINC